MADFGRFLLRVWRGEESLPFTYWVVGALFGVLCLGYIPAIILDVGFNVPRNIMTVHSIIFHIAQVFITISIWRSANNFVGPWHWKYLTYFICAGGLLLLADNIAFSIWNGTLNNFRDFRLEFVIPNS